MKHSSSGLRRKRTFDVLVTVACAVIWVPACALIALAIWLTEGRPIFYASNRRVVGGRTMRVIKFRTMVRNAEAVLNRDTVPIGSVRFLNIPFDHPVYTRVGRLLERFALTEIPQLVHVLSGRMSLIGNRPLPENVIGALRAEYPFAEDRFLTMGGLTGPVQLVGREAISDADRLGLEIDYCIVAMFGYRWRLDLAVLIYTVLIALHLHRPLGVQGVRALIASMTAGDRGRIQERLDEGRRTAIRFATPSSPVEVTVEGQAYEIGEFGRNGIKLLGDRPLVVGREYSVLFDEGATSGVCADVRWCRPLGDGRFEAGLSLVPAHGAFTKLLHAVDVSMPLRPFGAVPHRASTKSGALSLGADEPTR